MEQKSENEDRLVQYLLGGLPKEEMVKLEESYFLDDDLFDELQSVELELIDRYVEGDLSKAQQDQFEHFFLSTPARQKKLRFAKAFKKYVPSRTQVLRQYILDHIRNAFSITKTFVSSPVGAVASIILIVCFGLVVWRIFFYQSAQNRVLTALSNAYREQRYIEARISGVNHAPLSQTRGESQINVDKKELNRAELSALEEVSENPTPLSHHALGQVYLAEQRFGDAISEFNKALEMSPANARIHSDLGAALFEEARSSDDPQKKAAKFAESKIHLNKALELDQTRIEALFNRALWNESMSLPDQAQEDWRRYLEIDHSSPWADEARRHLQSIEEYAPKGSNQLFDEFKQARSAKDDAAAWKVLSQTHARTGNIIYEKLLDDYLALANSGKTIEARGEFQALSYAADLEYEKTGDHFTKDLIRVYALATPQATERLAEARALMKSAYEEYKLNEYEKAIEIYSRAREVFKKHNDECESLFAENWIANCYVRIPDAERGLAIFKRLSLVFSERRYKWLFGQLLNGTADAKSSKRNFSDALEYAKQSFDIGQSIQDPRMTLRNLQTFAVIQQQLGDYSGALHFVFRAFDLANTFSPEPHEIWSSYNQAANNYYALNFPAVALGFQQEALMLAIKSGFPLLKSRSSAQLALINQKLQDYAMAIKYGELSLAEAQNIAGQKSRINIVANSSLNLAHLYRESGDFARAFDYYDQAIKLHQELNLEIYTLEAHQGKLLSLIQLGDHEAIKEEIQTAVKLIEQYRSKITEESNRNKFFDLAQKIYDLATDFTYFQLKDTPGAFDYAERSRARSLLDLFNENTQVINGGGGPDAKLPPVKQPLSIAQIQQGLPERVQVVQYAVLNDKLITWVVSRDTVESKDKQITANELNQKVQAFLDSVVKSTGVVSEEMPARAKALYELLITPVESLLNTNDLIVIVPDKSLNRIAFGALTSPESGRYFIEDHTFEICQSSNIFIRCSDTALKKESITTERAFCIGNPKFDRDKFPSLSELGSAEKEARRIAEIYNPSSVLLREDATAKAVKAGMFKASVIHFAGHYRVDDRSPMSSGLLLAKEPSRVGVAQAFDGNLSSGEIYRMDMRQTRLVVLSACQTGIEQSYNGEGAISMARSFLKAGVPITVASLWPVETDPTADLMIAFHNFRKQGKPTVKALREAQLQMLHSPDLANRNPRLWAPFIAIGGYAKF